MKILCALSILCLSLLLGASDQSWKFPEMPCRTRLEWNSIPGLPAELDLDFEVLSRLAKQPLNTDPNGIRISAILPTGEAEVPMTIEPSTDTLLHVRFNPPEPATGAWLYFGGKSTSTPLPATSTNLIPNALESTGWKTVQGKSTVTTENHSLRWEAPASTAIRRDFPLPAGITPGSPLVLDFAVKSASAFAWNLSLRIRQLDATGQELPSGATDQRWSTFYLPVESSFANRIYGRLDPRTKSIRLLMLTNVPVSKYDLYGNPIESSNQSKLKAEFSRLELRVAQPIPFPSSNPDYFAPGVDGGMAFKLNGKHAPFFNANPPCVWSEGNQKLTDQADYHWSKGDGTFEAWLKPEFNSPNHTYTIVEVYQNFRKVSPLELTYTPDQQEWKLTVRDFGEHAKTIRAIAELPTAKWSHIAACWSTAKGIALFLNGKRIASDPNFHFQVTNLESVERCDSVMPDNISLGVARRPVRNARIEKGIFLEGALDQVRISTQARYSDDFIPAKKLKCDSTTCAFFDYEHTLDGVHGSGDGFIAGSVLAQDAPQATLANVETRSAQGITSESLSTYPDTIPEENHPRHTLPITNYPKMSTAKDFNQLRETRTHTFTVENGQKVHLKIAENVYMNWLDIACPEDSQPLVAPVVLNQGDIDIRSYGDLHDTLFPPDQATMSNHQRTIRLFSFLIHASDYFMSHQAKIDENNALTSAEYGGLGQIAGYCGFECGPLNNLTMNTFVNVLGKPASMTRGNFHLFEQVFYDGRWRLYDLSAQSYFPSRRQTDATCLDEIEQDPYLLGRIKDKLNAFHFYRLCARDTYTYGIQLQPKLAFTLNPGESFRVHWQNNGIYNDLQRAMPYIAKTLQGHGRNVTNETGVKTVRKGEYVCEFDRPFPHYSSGFLRFKGCVSASNPAFSQVREDSFIYSVKLPYPIVAATYHAEGSNLHYELSYDHGQTWRSLPTDKDGICHLTLEVRARNEYLLRVSGKRTGNFQAETCVQLNSRVLAGALHQGDNELTFKCDQPGTAKITYSYRVDTGREILLDNVVSWSAMPGEEKHLVLLNPDGIYEIEVSGLGAEAKLLTTGGIKAKRHGNKIQISTSDASARLAGLAIRDGNAEKQLVVAVLPGARWIPASQMRIESGAELLPPDETRTMPVVKTNTDGAQLSYKFSPIKAGKYLIFHLGRNPLHPAKSAPVQNQLAGDTFVQLIESGKPQTVLVRKSNNAAEFYKAEKLLWRFRWDYPICGKYPYELMAPLELPAGDVLSVRCTCPEIELAGALLLPADDPDFLTEFRKFCCGFNYQPLSFSNWVENP